MDSVDKLIDPNGDSEPSWKHRRRLIYGAYGLGVFMVLFGMVQFLFDTQAGVQAIVGGVSLITIIVSAYTGFSAWQDSRMFGYQSGHQQQGFGVGHAQQFHPEYDKNSDG
jgi:hypothetical protein